MQLIFVPFAREHFETYASWYADEAMRTFLGGIDEEWLEHVLKEDKQKEYVVFLDEVMIGEVGLVLPDEEYPYFAITNLAIHPLHRSIGVGKHLLQELMSLQDPAGALPWRCYIHANNRAARHFFEGQRWKLLDLPVQDSMLPYEWEIGGILTRFS